MNLNRDVLGRDSVVGTFQTTGSQASGGRRDLAFARSMSVEQVLRLAFSQRGVAYVRHASFSGRRRPTTPQAMTPAGPAGNEKRDQT